MLLCAHWPSEFSDSNLNQRPNSFDPSWKGINLLFFSCCPFSGWYSPPQSPSGHFQIYGLWSTIFWTTDCYLLDIGQHSLFKPLTIRGNEKENRSFANKALNAINLDNILHHKSVKAMVPPYFKDQSVPIISYSYSSSIAPKIFNNKRVLQDFSIKI
jgi:hypothetical protein